MIDTHAPKHIVPGPDGEDPTGEGWHEPEGGHWNAPTGRFQTPPPGDMYCEIAGPRDGGGGYYLVVSGHEVPYLELFDITERWNVSPPAEALAEWADEGQRLQKHAAERGERIFNLVIDHRFGHTATEAEVIRWGWFLGNAMAVSAGYTSHGEGSRRLNRHGPSRK